MEPEILDLPEFIVAGLQVRAQAGQSDLGAVWGRLGASGAERLPRRNPGRAFGVTSDFDEKTRQFSYLAGYEVEPGAHIPEGIAAIEVPAQTYAVFRTALPDLMNMLHQANHVWLPGSIYRRGDGPEFELYDEHFDPTDPQSQMAFYLPVVPR